jgi:hypothetical protein
VYILVLACSPQPLSPFVSPDHIAISVSQKRIVKRVLTRSSLGLKDTTQAHYDIILEIRHLLSVLNVPINPIHVPGQMTLKIPTQKQPETHNSVMDTTSVERLLSHVVTIYHKGIAITDNLDPLVHHEIHTPKLKEKLMKDNGWTEEQLESITWDEFHSALKKVPRSHRVSIAKLTHQLWNTNLQNKKYYSSSDTCTLCSTASETIDHTYQCTHSSAVAIRMEALVHLLEKLKKSTPDHLLQAIEFLCTSSTRTENLSPIIAEAIAQQKALGETSLFRGHISKKWHDAYNAAQPQHSQQCVTCSPSSKWIRSLITAMWEYSKSLWKHRNSAVHGKASSFTESKEMKSLRLEAEAAYSGYADDPHYISHSRRWLFDKPVESIKSLDHDSLHFWCLSVREAELTNIQRANLERKKKYGTLHSYFQPVGDRPIHPNRSPKASLFTPPFSKKYYQSIGSSVEFHGTPKPTHPSRSNVPP